MNLFKKIKIKTNSLRRYYLFQKRGIPKIKQDQISKSMLKRYLPPNPIIIDCGAHDGTDSIELVKILKGEIHAFEPIPEIFERLQRNVKHFNNIHCYNIALSDITSDQIIYVSEGESDASSSLLPPKAHLADHPDTLFKKTIKIDAFSLDDWGSKNNISKVDLLWLDMQGFELNMLMASKYILQTVKVIHTEVSTKETYSGVNLYKDYKIFLESKGFKAIIEAIPENWDMGNVLFVRN